MSKTILNATLSFAALIVTAVTLSMPADASPRRDQGALDHARNRLDRARVGVAIDRLRKQEDVGKLHRDIDHGHIGAAIGELKHISRAGRSLRHERTKVAVDKIVVGIDKSRLRHEF